MSVIERVLQLGYWIATERTALLKETLPPFDSGLKWYFHVLLEEMLLSSLGHCL